MKDIAFKAKKASKELLKLDKNTRNEIYNNLIINLKNKEKEIVEANHIDVTHAKKEGLSEAMIDRLIIDEARLSSIVESVKSVRDQEEVVGVLKDAVNREDGLVISKQAVPIGVILMIFESRPNVVIDSAILALKSSNAIILKGGKEARFTNKIFGEIISESIKDFIPTESVQVLDSDDRNLVNDLLSYNEFIDVVIPRGGHGLINHVYKNAKMPVIAHFRGLCHMYIDKEADIDKATDLIVNAKTQRPGVCNALETLLIHEDVLESLCSKLLPVLLDKGTELRVDNKIYEKFSMLNVSKASENDWQTEYLKNILSIKTVPSLDEAITHIATYGSNHTESIVTENQDVAMKFLNQVDASCVMVNSSTRFNDGGELGLGAEIGISTSKIHAYGPMGASQMTTNRYVVMGNGHVRC